jgi:hypothetical protein
MKRKTYTMFLKRNGRNEVVARSVSIDRALVIAVEHGGRGKAAIVHRNIGEFPLFHDRSLHGCARGRPAPSPRPRAIPPA